MVNDDTETPDMGTIPKFGCQILGSPSLSKLGIMMGRPLKTGRPTKEIDRLGYAQLLIKVKEGEELPDKTKFATEKDILIKQQAIYKWRVPDAHTAIEIDKPGCLIYKLMTSLKYLKKPLRELNRNYFNDIHHRREIMRTSLEAVPRQLQLMPENLQSSIADGYIKSLSKAMGSLKMRGAMVNDKCLISLNQASKRNKGFLSFEYLGVPITFDRLSSSDFQHLDNVETQQHLLFVSQFTKTVREEIMKGLGIQVTP
ncbi:hypothetical protein Cgig2_018739 [Carnegiea gigantea]|uniref:Uncharacterized protein n=1 Tax=Carnegiea gigantea TaxID=171969 RepID=A0A9Q1GV43_9CARY|nr:hypothetical protein Cgig2_018739 [Carnegiea gigantea]